MKEIKRKEFDNGLVLLTEKIPSKKKVTLLAGVKVGSVNETEKLSGGSHFNEHLLFKSNKHRSAKEVIEHLEQSGTSVNAFTAETATAFYAKALPDELTKAIQIVYEAATNFEYNAEEFERERQVVLTEIQLYNDQPITYSEILFESFLFQETPLEKWVGGTIETMGNVTKEELANFKQEYYIPDNMAIVAVGNFNEQDLERKVSETFGTLQKGKMPNLYEKISMENKHREKFEEKEDTDQTYLYMGYRVPGMTHEDAYKLKMLEGLLSAGMSSRLFQRLREEKGIGYDVRSIYRSFRDAGCFTTYVAGFDSKRFDEAKETILKEFKDLKQNLVSDKEFERTKNLLISKSYDNLESIDNRALDILEQEFDNIPYDFRKAKTYLNKVTKKDVREMANKYLSDEYTLTALKPAKQK